MLLRFQIDMSLRLIVHCLRFENTRTIFYTTWDTPAECHKLVLGFNIAAECVFPYNTATLLANRPLVRQVIQQCFIEAGNWTATSKAIFHANKMEYPRNAVLHKPPICIRGHNVTACLCRGIHPPVHQPPLVVASHPRQPLAVSGAHTPHSHDLHPDHRKFSSRANSMSSLWTRGKSGSQTP